MKRKGEKGDREEKIKLNTIIVFNFEFFMSFLKFIPMQAVLGPNADF
jgi:hypothetical protein